MPIIVEVTDDVAASLHDVEIAIAVVTGRAADQSLLAVPVSDLADFAAPTVAAVQPGLQLAKESVVEGAEVMVTMTLGTVVLCLVVAMTMTVTVLVSLLMTVLVVLLVRVLLVLLVMLLVAVLITTVIIVPVELAVTMTTLAIVPIVVPLGLVMAGSMAFVAAALSMTVGLVSGLSVARGGQQAEGKR